MKITTRLMALLFLIAVLFFVWLLYIQRSAQQHAMLVLSVNVNSKNTGFDRIIKLEGAPFEALVYDFSCRDDLVSFMQKPERAWADQHLVSLLPGYKLNGAWIYDSSFGCVYGRSLVEGMHLPELPISRKELSQELEQRYFHHFFLALDVGILELRCAPIQPGTDWERKSRPRGFLFLGRLWNETYLAELSALTESRVMLRRIDAAVPVPPPSFDLALGAISFSRIFRSWDGEPIAELAVQSEVPVLRELALSTRAQLLQLIGFLSVILTVLFIAFLYWVRLPLRKLSQSLAQSDEAPLAGLQNRKTEYGDLARLMIHFFKQQQDLSAEIHERKQVQEALENTNDMLRTREQTLQSLNFEFQANVKKLEASENILRESEERYRSLVEHIELGIALMDKDYKILMVNRKCAEMYGRPVEEYVGKFCHNEFKKLGSCCPACPGASAMKTGVMAQAEQESVRRDGSRFATNTLAFPVFEEGAVTGFIEIREDITLRRELEEKLGDREAFFRAQFELGNIGIAITAVDKSWLRVNQRLCSMFGYAEEEFYGKTWLDLTYPDDRACDAEHFERLLAGELEAYEVDKRFVCKNGDILWTHLAVACSRKQDRSVRFVIASIQDITQRRQMEEQLRQSQKMEAIGTLAGGIAHDFNNILAAIVGNAELALLKLTPGTPAAGNIGQILKASGRARELVGQILAFSRRQDQERRPVDICMIVKEAVKLLRAIVPATIELQVSMPGGSHIVEADPTRMHQVIINLCTNAVQAMEALGGTLEIQVSALELDTQSLDRYQVPAPGPYVRFMVRDTGPGIEPQHMERIFDPFFTTKDVGKGTGMGLAVAHGIVTDHGGSITAYSRQGKGATFYVLIPQAVGEIAANAQPLTEIPRGGGTVLLIDDEEMLVDLGTAMLQSLGYSVVGTTNSLDALKLFTADPQSFDAVITDFTMPYLTGFELAQEFLRMRPDTPIVLCTGFSSQISEEQADAAGIRAFIMKPFNMREIAETLQKVLPNPA